MESKGSRPAYLGHGKERCPRLPTVEEALRYSPITSIAPFDPDIIPFPLAYPPANSSTLLSHSDRSSAKATIDHLSFDAASAAESASRRLQHTLKGIQHLLQPGELTEYTFKRPFRAATNSQQHQLNGNNTSNIPQAPRLSAFARMVLGSTAVPYRYSTPVSPDANSDSKEPSALPTSRKPQHLTPRTQSDVATQSSGNHTDKCAVSTPVNGSHPTPDKKIKQKIAVAVVVPPFDLSQRSQYEVVSDDDRVMKSSASSPSTKRNHDDAATKDAKLAVTVDHRQKAGAAVRALTAALDEIFEAEDCLQPGTSDVVPLNAAHVFVVGAISDCNVPILQQSMQIRLDSALQKVTSLHVLHQFPVEQISRIQRLCGTVISATETTKLTIGDCWTESDIEEWTVHITIAESGLVACRTMLRIMSAGREERQLYSEDHLRVITSAVGHVVDSCIVPIVEARNSGREEHVFRVASAQRTAVLPLLHSCNKILCLLGELVSKVDVDETAIAAIEFVAKKLLFVENAGSEKDSALGVARFEVLRRGAMDAVEKIFSSYPEQRTFIFDEILSSLEKLPVTRQSARQYKLNDGKPIQLVSALLMRLVQTSATHDMQKQRTVRPAGTDKEQRHVDNSDSDDSEERSAGPRSEDTEPVGHQLGDADLDEITKPLFDAANRNAHYCIDFIVRRALSSTKSGDQPYRNLLDIFTEDFVNIIGSTDWPAAELLLRALLSQLIRIMDNDKSSAPARAMALELMGLMATGISDLQGRTRQTYKSLESAQSDVSSRLAQLAEDILDGKALDGDVLSFDGPYRYVLEHLQVRDINNAELKGARGFHLTQWARSVWSCREASAGKDGAGYDELLTKLGDRIKRIILDPTWFECHSDFETVSTTQARLSCDIFTLHSPFCRHFHRIFNILLVSMSSDQATIRSKSLKSIVSLIEKDPSLLDRGTQIMGQILRCTEDASPLVRDSALSLTAKCLSLRPRLDRGVYERIAARVGDSTYGVRRRTMSILKDIYLRNDALDLRSRIAESLLERIKDSDQKTSEMARQIFEEIWVTPFHFIKGDKEDTVQSRLTLRDQVYLIAKTAQRGEATVPVLQALVQDVISNQSVDAAANFRVCRVMVTTIFDCIVGKDDTSSKPPRAAMFQLLAIFAKASPKLFDASQMGILQPYTENLSSVDDLNIFKPVVVILRYVMPQIASLPTDFLRSIQDALMRSVSSIVRAEVLQEVAQCLWTIDRTLNNTEKIVKLMASVLTGLHGLQRRTLDSKEGLRASRYMTIAGCFGKVCKLDDQTNSFKEKLVWWKGDSVAGLVVDMICPLTSSDQPQNVREQAVESICMLCHAWPKQFLRDDVTNAFELVFKSGNSRLEYLLLSSLSTFFTSQEVGGDADADATSNGTGAERPDRLSKTYVATDNDGASAALAQKFLKDVLRNATSSTDEKALTATQIVASINRQSSVYPGEYGPTLVALTSSPNPDIANLAFQEHRVLHNKHESMFEKEYSRAVLQAFEHQRDIVHDTLGVTGRPPCAKLALFWEVLKTGSAKVRKRVLANLCTRLDFDPAKLDVSGEQPVHLELTRFSVENIAFFDYHRVEELMHLLPAMERIVQTTGSSIAHAIETEILRVRPEPDTQAGSDVNGIASAMPAPAINDQASPQRLRHLTVAAQILYLIWETRTFLRRVWGLQKAGSVRTKSSTKDSNRAPVKISNALAVSDRYLIRTTEIMRALASTESQVALCAEFVELLSIDNEVRIALDNEEEASREAGYHTPSDQSSPKSTSVPPSGGGRGRKRKGSSVAGTPRKRRVSSKKPSAGRKKASSMNKEERDQDTGWE
ncbi:Sister chromatid cohesion protein 2 [Elasticomyces elasticus]|nr:Sister chromatid cohesion protein 2 [Elasticomyces elasticus]KAK5000458.1 Sister chromatid cohesion protein 2 [Elasticomyces elasticus]